MANRPCRCDQVKDGEFILEYFSGQCPHRSLSSQKQRLERCEDCYRAGCLTCTEASAMALALEEAKNFILRSSGKGTGDRTQICISHPGFRTKFKGKLGRSWLPGLKTVSLEARFPCSRTSPFKKGPSGSISVCKITPGLNNQPFASRKQSQFKLVSAVLVSPFFFIHSSVLREIMCRLR